MQSATQLTLPCEVISAGVDWITATARTGGSRPDMEALATHELRRAVDAGEEAEPASRLGYKGYAVRGFFFGERHGSAMIQASGPAAHNVWRAVASVADNVSRVDLETTVYTILEQPHVAKIVHENLKRGEHGKYKVKNATYIEGLPNGETINVNKRSSDTSGRIYDKASESDMGVPRSVWRYEVELHRAFALAACDSPRSASDAGAQACSLVYRWFHDRGITPIYDPSLFPCTQGLLVGKRERDTLAWFRDTLRKTVATQIEKHGLEVVLESLNLSHYLNQNRKEDSTNASRS